MVPRTSNLVQARRKIALKVSSAGLMRHSSSLATTATVSFQKRFHNNRINIKIEKGKGEVAAAVLKET